MREIGGLGAAEEGDKMDSSNSRREEGVEEEEEILVGCARLDVVSRVPLNTIRFALSDSLPRPSLLRYPTASLVPNTMQLC